MRSPSCRFWFRFIYPLSGLNLTLPLWQSVALGVASLTVGAAPLAAQIAPAELSDNVDETLSFCQTLQTQIHPWDSSPDLSVLSEAISSDEDIDRLCDWFGEQVLPLNFLLASDAAMAQQAIEQGADVNARDGNGNTPLHYAGDSVEIARSLIERGADVNATNLSGIAPLHNGFGEKTPAVIALLIEAGADVNVAAEDGTTPLHLVSNSFAGGEIAALLIRRGASVNVRTRQNWTPLHYAAARPDIAVHLIEAGADPTLQNREGEVIHAVSLSPEVLPLLMAAGANVDAQNLAGETPLHRQRTNIDMTKALLVAGADVNIQDNQGRTPLYEVSIQVAEMLLAAGARLDVRDNQGRTPLHQAVLEEQVFFGPELVDLFLKAGADASVKDNYGETALDIARRLDKSHVAARFPESDTIAGVEILDGVSSPPPVESTNAQIETIQQNTQDLLQSARQNALSDEQTLEQLGRAAEWAQQLSAARDRNPLLYEIGLELLKHGQLEEARAISELTTYDRETNFSKGRPQMEEALVVAYVRAGEMAQVRSLIDSAKPSFQDSYWVKAIEALTDRGDLATAKSLVDKISAGSYALESAIREISRAYVGLEAFEQAASFVEQQSLRRDDFKAFQIKNISVWAGRSGELETARAAIAQLAPLDRAKALIDLAESARYRGQRELAMSLLAEAAQPFEDDLNQQSRLALNADINGQSAWQTRFDLNYEIASRYVELGRMDRAKQLIIAAEQANPTPTEGTYPTAQWVGAFAKFGSVDRAAHLIDNLPTAQRTASQWSFAKAFVETAQYKRALTVINQIPQRISFSRPKQRLLQQIIEETLAAGEYNISKRAAETIQNPGDKASSWIKIAAAYQENQQMSEATEALGRAFELISSVERQNGWLDIDFTSKTSKSDLLLKIAEGYWAAGQRRQAKATAKAAVDSVTYQAGDNFFYSGSSTLRAIARAGRNWPAPTVQEAAASKLEERLDLLFAEETVDRFEKIRRLIELVEAAYHPNRESSEHFDRYMAQLKRLVEQDVDSGRSPAILHELVSTYTQIDCLQAARAAIAELLTWVEAQPVEERDGHYWRLANSTLRTPELEEQFQIIARISTAEKQIEVLEQIVPSLAREDDLSIEYFDRLMALAETSLSRDAKERVAINLAQRLSNFETGGSYGLSPRTVDQAALMMRLPQHIDDPLLQASMWISFMPHLSSAQKEQAYEALSVALEETSSDYDRRNMLWYYVEEALRYEAFEEATQIANALEGEYRRTALGWIEATRE